VTGSVLGSPAGETSRPSLRYRLRSRDPIVGTFSILPCPEIIELVALAGFDAVIIDMEHGPYTAHHAYLSMLAAERHGMATLVRVPSPDSPLIGVLLDLGVEAVIVPHVSNAGVAQQVVRACRFSRKAPEAPIRGCARQDTPRHRSSTANRMNGSLSSR
jgi:2-keto-3-deoxy-L-rhamnonate aldolase RhmA